MKQWIKHTVLYLIGGVLYVLLEFLWRGHSHWTMFILGGCCFVGLGLINELIPWEMLLWKQVLIGTIFITLAEFIVGCIVNLCLGLRVWDYSALPGNLFGQICPQYVMFWIPISLAGIIVDDWFRYWLFRESKPRYKFF